MLVKYLSEDWANEMQRHLSASEALRTAARGQSITVQQIITGAGSEDVKFYMRLSNGEPEIALGEVQRPEATITQSYATAAAIDRGELNPVQAFALGQLTIQGDISKLAQFSAVLMALPQALAGLEREYAQ